MPRCPMCQGPAIRLGVLGLLKWFRCRDCGLEFHRPVRRKPKPAR
jgi:hypothetical protein